MKKILHTLLLSLLFFAATALQAQDAITPYMQVFPPTLAPMALHGSVKFMHYTELSFSETDTVKRESTFFFNAKGLLTKEIHTDPCLPEELTHSYDSLGRFVSTISSDGMYRNDAFYDSLGHFIYNIHTRNGVTEKNFIRYYYDEKGRCIYHEYIPNNDDEKLRYGYDVLRRIYEYDSLDRCILGAELVDGDTSYIETRVYDANGNITKSTYYTPCSDEDSSVSLYFYNEDNLLKKSQDYFGGELVHETVCEYDDMNQMIRCFVYDNDGKLYIYEESEYDIHHNRIKSEIKFYDEDSHASTAYQVQIVYEYYEE